MEAIFTVVSNLMPTVTLTSPMGGAFQPGSPVPLVATASDLGGSIARVEFYVKEHSSFDSPLMLVGVAQTAPYHAQARDLPPGHYMALAVATDNQGATGQAQSHYSIEPPPVLSITRDGNLLTICWPAHTHGYVLQEITNLSLPINWVPVTAAVVHTCEQHCITVPVDPVTKFFRLSNAPTTACGWSKCDPNSPLTGRFEHTEVWTGTEMIIWGGRNASGNTSSVAPEVWCFRKCP